MLCATLLVASIPVVVGSLLEFNRCVCRRAAQQALLGLLQVEDRLFDPFSRNVASGDTPPMMLP